MQYVYLLENKYSPNVYKIGWTSRHPDIRAKEISQGTGVVGTWEVSYFWEVEDGYWLEQRIFRKFTANRIDKSEMFHFDSLSALQLYEEICNLMRIKGNSPKEWREIREKEVHELTEIKNLKIQITNLKDKIIDIETKPYYDELFIEYIISWIFLSCIIGYLLRIINSEVTLIGATGFGIVTSAILLFILNIYMNDLINNLFSNCGQKIDKIKNQYSQYDNLEDNLDNLRNIYKFLSNKIK